VMLAGCGSGGPEAFAPGTTPTIAPAAANASESNATGPKPIYKKGSTQTAGPMAQP
jgi:hypothetical protein